MSTDNFQINLSVSTSDVQVLLKEYKSQTILVGMLRDILEKLACLGNGDQHGNSLGNDIAKEGLKLISNWVAQNA